MQDGRNAISVIFKTPSCIQRAILRKFYFEPRTGHAPKNFYVRARPGNSRRALRRTNPDTVGLRREEEEEKNVNLTRLGVCGGRGGGGGELATQNERQREQEVISVKVDAALSLS